jgi:hypothetical protein
VVSIFASSISFRAANTLRPGVTGRVLASFTRVCDLITGDGAVVALVWNGVGNGPLNVVLADSCQLSVISHQPSVISHQPSAISHQPSAISHQPSAISHQPSAISHQPSAISHQLSAISYQPSAISHQPSAISNPQSAIRFAVEGQVLRIGDRDDPDAVVCQVDLSTAARWDPRPDWEALRPRWARIAERAAVIADVLSAYEPEVGDWRSTIADATALFCRCQLTHVVSLRIPHSAIYNLIGLGPGLTPAGDDWLAGWLLAGWLKEGGRGVRSIADLILAAAAERTTTLSRAFLECAAAGEADENWHALLNALASESSTDLPIYHSTHIILSHGATSGAAMLAGFLAGISHPA